MTATRSPRATRWSAKVEPMNPAPPVMKIFMTQLLLIEPGLHRGDDAVLGRSVEVGMHGQAQHLLRQSLGDRYSRVGLRVMAIGGLLRQRQRIVDRDRDAGRLAGRDDAVA